MSRLGLPILSAKLRTLFDIEDVAAHRVRHFEMQTDELENGFALFHVEVKARQETVGEFDALRRVFAIATAFAGVVQE